MYKNLQNYIPENKHDLDAVQKLSQYDYPFYKDILAELFEWIKDINWPVAKHIIPLLIKAGKDIIPHVRIILRTDDSVWKHWVLLYVVGRMDRSLKQKILTELNNEMTAIVLNPSAEDRLEEIDIIIEDLFRDNDITDH